MSRPSQQQLGFLFYGLKPFLLLVTCYTWIHSNLHHPYFYCPLWLSFRLMLFLLLKVNSSVKLSTSLSLFLLMMRPGPCDVTKTTGVFLCIKHEITAFFMSYVWLGLICSVCVRSVEWIISLVWIQSRTTDMTATVTLLQYITKL